MPFHNDLVKLLEEEKIPYRRVGNRRRVMLSSLITCKRIDDADRAAAADRLTAEALVTRGIPQNRDC